MTRKDGPTMAWDKDGNSQVFPSAAEIPEGFSDRHPADLAHSTLKEPTPPKPNTLPMTKAEIVEALKAGGIEAKPNMGAKALYDLLLTSLRDVLTESQIAFDPEADAPALLKLVPKNE